jgi:hypothetical protein
MSELRDEIRGKLNSQTIVVVDAPQEQDFETILRAADASTLSNEQLEIIFDKLPTEWAAYAREVAVCLRRRSIIPQGYAFPKSPVEKQLSQLSLADSFAAVGKALQAVLETK